MTLRVLVVCRANLCRSPAAGALLESRLQVAGLGDHVEVTTAGVAAGHPTSQPCPVMLAALPTALPTALPMALPTALGRRLVDHQPVQLTAEQVDAADLVLAADRLTRATILHERPGAHDRVLTLRHAAVLGEQAAVEPVLDQAVGADPADRMRAHLSRLASLRSHTAAPHLATHRLRRRPWRRVDVHDHDVPDAHPDSALHPLVATLLDTATRDLVRTLAASST